MDERCTDPTCPVCRCQGYEELVETSSPLTLKTIAYTWLLTGPDERLVRTLFGDLMDMTPEQRDETILAARAIVRGEDFTK